MVTAHERLPRAAGPASVAPLSRPPWARVEPLLTALVLLVGVALRIWRLDLAQVNFDESNVASLVAAWKHQDAFPLAGTVSTVGIPAPPGWPWFVALGTLWTDDPSALVVTGVSAGLLAMLCCWWVARRWLGPWGGLAAAVFYGTAFYVVLLERGGWLPVFLQVPLVLCLDGLLVLATRQRPWALVAAAGWMGVLLSLHYTTVPYLVLLPVAAWPARRSIKPLHVAAAALAGAIPLAGFLAFELQPPVQMRDLVALLTLSGGPSSVDLDTVISVVQVASTQGAAGLGGHAAAELGRALGRWTAISLIGPVLATAGLVAFVGARPRGIAGWLLVAWLLVPILAYLRHSAGVIFHYMYLEFPGLALAVGAIAAWAAAKRQPLLPLTVGAAIAAYGAVSAASLLVLLSQLDQLDMQAGYGIPLGATQQAGQVAKSFLRPNGVVLIGDDPRHGEVLRFTVGSATPSQTFDDCRTVPNLPRAVYLLSSERTPGARVLEQAGAPLLARLARPGGDAFRVYGPIPEGQSIQGLDTSPESASAVCSDRGVWEKP